MEFSSTFNSFKKQDLVLLLVWTCAAFIISFHHEIWRDEMRALSIAIDCDSWIDLPNCLKNEGHPILWYLLLKIGYWIFPSPAILKVVAVFFGVISGWLFMYFFKIPRSIKWLFLFSNFMFWENTIMCRNYGIATFLIIIFSIVYERKYVLASIVVLALLVQTNVIGMIVANCLLLLVYRDLYCKKTVLNWSQILVGSIIMVASLSLFYYLTLPSPISNVTAFKIGNGVTFFEQIIKAMMPGNIMPRILQEQLLVSVFILSILFLYFVRNKAYLILLYFAYILIHFIDENVYDIDARHLGVFFMYIIYLIQRHYNEKDGQINRIYDKIEEWELKIFYPLILLVLVGVNIVMCVNDYNTEITSSRALAHYIKIGLVT